MKMRHKTPFIFLLIGLLFVVLGLWQGEFQQVNNLGISICLECMGLG